MPCRYCGQYHGAHCPLIKAVEYYPDGGVKRVEFRDALGLSGPTVRPMIPDGPSYVSAQAT